MDIWRHLPPLAALRAFCAWAETGSMTAAGVALNVSHAAISQQIRALEAHLGLALIERGSGTVQLTEDGARLAHALRSGFGEMARVVAELTGAEAGRPLLVTTTPSFAAGWLLPRLPRFRAAHPGVELRLDPASETRPLVAGGIDLAIRFGDGRWPGLEATHPLATDIVVAGSAALTHGIAENDIAALADLPWLTEPGCEQHVELFRQHGLTGFRGQTLYLPGPMLLQALRDGQGVALTASLLIADDVAEGRLRVLAPVQRAQNYWLVHRPGPLRPPARAFASWLRREAAADARPRQIAV